MLFIQAQHLIRVLYLPLPDDPLVGLVNGLRQPIQHGRDPLHNLPRLPFFEIRFLPMLLQQVPMSFRVRRNDLAQFLHLS